MDTPLTVEEILIHVDRNELLLSISPKSDRVVVLPSLNDLREVYAPAISQAMEALGLEFKEKGT